MTRLGSTSAADRCELGPAWDIRGHPHASDTESGSDGRCSRAQLVMDQYNAQRHCEGIPETSCGKAAGLAGASSPSPCEHLWLGMSM
jgi:hypothetical protein